MTLTGKARVAGVIGWPVAHSRSPRLHGYWLKRYGIDGAYVPLPVKPEHAREAIRALLKLGLRGANVTIPHKEAALAACDETDEAARAIGAVNTLVCTDDGRLLGRNTDAFGFIENLREVAPGLALEGRRAVVLGAGGSARAVIYALAKAGAAEIAIVNRTPARAQELARDLGAVSTAKLGALAVADLPHALKDAVLLANATSRNGGAAAARNRARSVTDRRRRRRPGLHAARNAASESRRRARTENRRRPRHAHPSGTARLRRMVRR